MRSIDEPIEITARSRVSVELTPQQSDIKILIHGWNAHSNHISMQTVRNAYLKRGVSHVMAVDWREIAELPYIVARNLIAVVGGRICSQLRHFADGSNVTAANMHIVAHSLGCHIATHVGRCFGGKIDRFAIKKFN
jgi:alpha-beta hydrolase superfamily lysophospholipase